MPGDPRPMNRDTLVSKAHAWAREGKLKAATIVSIAVNGYVLIGALGEDGSFENTHETVGVPIEQPVHTFMVDVEGTALHICAGASAGFEKFPEGTVIH